MSDPRRSGCHICLFATSGVCRTHADDLARAIAAIEAAAIEAAKHEHRFGNEHDEGGEA